MNATLAPGQPETALAVPVSQTPIADLPVSLGIDLRGPCGRLEALLNQGAPGATSAAPLAALICHPHPRFGGTMHNQVVYHAMKALNDAAWGLQLPVLRFNFRGTGLSQGEHDGEAETGDVLAALEWLEHEYQQPVVVAGFSFGAAMALRASIGQPNVSALIALGLPVQAGGVNYRYSFLKNCTIPKLFLSGDRDLFAPADQLTAVVAQAAESKRLVLVPGADHFFTGHLAAMQHELAGWLKEQMG